MAHSFSARRLSSWFILFLALCGSLFYLYHTFNYDPTPTQIKVKPDIEIHFGGPPLQEKEGK